MIDLYKLLIVGLGGFIGAIGRYAVSGWIQSLSKSPWYPFGTLGVNFIGCLLIGFLGGLVKNKELFQSGTRLFLLVGLLGAFTTFSTFGYETFSLLRGGQFLLAGGNVAAQVILGLIGVWLGFTLSNLV
ncbi:MAG TPA: fluoride efflux transporter CrcB [Proteobacteria bacterium]|nr:fluoride efflux transporter CrcB [Pseudomonadota bacterium]